MNTDGSYQRFTIHRIRRYHRSELTATVRVLTALSIVLMLAGCGDRLNFFQEQERWWLEIRNETNQPVQILLGGVTTGTFIERITVEPNSSGQTALVVPCTDHRYLAQFEDGTEVDRLEPPPPICDGDVWVIEEP